MTAPKNDIKEGKHRPTLLPMDIITEVLCPAYEEGVDKYYRESWRQGFEISKMIDAASRHIDAFFYEGKNIDLSSSTKKHHLGGAIFSLISAYHTLKYHPELDDRRDQVTGELIFKKEAADPGNCPYDNATTCMAGEPCIGCDTFLKHFKGGE